MNTSTHQHINTSTTFLCYVWQQIWTFIINVIYVIILSLCHKEIWSQIKCLSTFFDSKNMFKVPR